MRRVVALLFLAALVGSTAVLGEEPSLELSPNEPGALPRVDRNSIEGVREWMEFIGGLRFAPAEGERGCPNRLALGASLAWGEGGRAAFADYRETGNEAQRMIARLALEGFEALLPFSFSSNPCIRDFVRPYYGMGLLGLANSEGIPATPAEQEAVEAALRRAERPISPITGIGAAKWVDDFAVAEIHRQGEGCRYAAIVWRNGETLQPFVEVSLSCY